MAGQHPGRGERPGTRGGDAFPRPERMLPGWRSALVVVAHPDDETFGLGALIAGLTTSGTAVHVLCFTRGEASTLNENDSDLLAARARELRQAGSALGVASVTLLDYPDGRLASIPPAELAAHVTRLAGRHRPDGLLVFDDTGITCHPDHQAATRAAVHAAGAAGLPVLAWVLPDAIAGAAGGDRRDVRRPAGRPHRPVRPGGPGRAAQGCAPACQPDLAHRGAMAAAAAAR